MSDKMILDFSVHPEKREDVSWFFTTQPGLIWLEEQ